MVQQLPEEVPPLTSAAASMRRQVAHATDCSVWWYGLVLPYGSALFLAFVFMSIPLCTEALLFAALLFKCESVAVQGHHVSWATVQFGTDSSLKPCMPLTSCFGSTVQHVGSECHPNRYQLCSWCLTG